MAMIRTLTPTTVEVALKTSRKCGFWVER